MVIGEMPDSSIVLVYAFPKGVKLSGTPTRIGVRDSQAFRLARST